MIETVASRVLRFGAAVIVLGVSGCATLDPDGEWRGTPEARLRSCQAMFGPAAVSVREQVAAATGSPPVSAAPAAPAAAAALATPVAQQCTATASASPAPQVPAPVAHGAPTAQALEQIAHDAERAYTDGRYAEAVDLLDAFLRARPDHAPAWLRKANALHRAERTGEAAMAYRRVLALSLDPAAAAGLPEPTVADIRSKASANLAILGIEQAKQALDALGPADGHPVAAAHRARIEAAMRAVIGVSPDNASSGAASGHSAPSIRAPAAAPRPSAFLTAPATAGRAPPAAGSGALIDEPAPAFASLEPPAVRPAVEVIRGLVSR